MKFLSGQTLRFTYREHAGASPDESSDDFKEVLVLHPNWQGRLHGIDLKRLTSAERETLDAVFNPDQKGKPHRFPLVNDILRRMNPIEEVKNPVSFYSKFVKVFLRNKDAYRTYNPSRILNVTISEQTSVIGKVINPTPLFHKVESKTAPDAPISQAPPAGVIDKQARLNLIRQTVNKRTPPPQKGKVQRGKIQRPPRPK